MGYGLSTPGFPAVRLRISCEMRWEPELETMAEVRTSPYGTRICSLRRKNTACLPVSCPRSCICLDSSLSFDCLLPFLTGMLPCSYRISMVLMVGPSNDHQIVHAFFHDHASTKGLKPGILVHHLRIFHMLGWRRPNWLIEALDIVIITVSYPLLRR